jgi:uncharacterized heparinase superfamily protein
VASNSSTLGGLARAGLLLRTLRFLSAEQIAHRAILVTRRRWWRWTNAECVPAVQVQVRPFIGTLPGLIGFGAEAELAQAVTEEILIARAVQAGRFRFLGRELFLGSNPDWQITTASQLWRYQLHYFGFVRSLLVAAHTKSGDWAYEVFRGLTRSWIERNKKLVGDGWHPYTISLRLVNWLQAWACWRSAIEADATFCSELLGMMYSQARSLRRQLEFDVRGNHLLENLRALIWAGLAFEGREAQGWLDLGLTILREETVEQVLPDGGHFERTPGYHATVLRDYLEIATVLERNGEGRPEWVRGAVERLAFFLREILGPRQRIPLIKDSAIDATPNPDELLNTAAAWLDEPGLKPAAAPSLDTYLLLGEAEWKKIATWPEAPRAVGTSAFPVTGFYVLRGREGEQVVIDAGKPCPDYLPAHAHADTLNFEYSIHGVPVIVDSGVYEYQAGLWRDFFRSTRAHNTIEIAGHNSSEVWSSFRVGRRAHPRIKAWQSAAGQAQILVAHDGYRHLRGEPVHERAILWHEGEYLIVIDRVTGHGVFPIASYLHFHPILEPCEEGHRSWTVDVQGLPLWLHQIGSGEVRVESRREQPSPQGWYSERFGEKEPNTVLSFHNRGVLPHASGYAFSSHKGFACTMERKGVDVRLFVSFADGTCSYRISEDTVECFA